MASDAILAPSIASAPRPRIKCSIPTSTSAGARHLSTIRSARISLTEANNEVERRAVASSTNEADLSRSSTLPLAHRGVRGLWIVRNFPTKAYPRLRTRYPDVQHRLKPGRTVQRGEANGHEFWSSFATRE